VLNSSFLGLDRLESLDISNIKAEMYQVNQMKWNEIGLNEFVLDNIWSNNRYVALNLLILYLLDINNQQPNNFIFYTIKCKLVSLQFILREYKKQISSFMHN